jgi:ATP sulfurylase
VDRHVDADGAAALRERAARLPQVTLTAREVADLDLIASGAASPLSGFMGLRDYRSVLARLRLADGTPWPVPFTLAVTVPQMASALHHGAAALRDPRRRLRGVIAVTDAFVRDPREEALALYGTDDRSHRGVAHLLSRPTGVLGGRIDVLPSSHAPEAIRPHGVRARARLERWTGMRAVATTDGAGCLEPTGSPHPELLRVLPVAVRLAPGRDAFLQAIVLKNYGALDVFFEHDRANWLAASPGILPEDLGITPLWFAAAGRGGSPRSLPSLRSEAGSGAQPSPEHLGRQAGSLMRESGRRRPGDGSTQR